MYGFNTYCIKSTIFWQCTLLQNENHALAKYHATSLTRVPALRQLKTLASSQNTLLFYKSLSPTRIKFPIMLNTIAIYKA